MINTRIIVLVGLLVSCGSGPTPIFTPASNLAPDYGQCEHIVYGMCVQLDGQKFWDALLDLSMGHLETVTNETWPGLDLRELMESTNSELVYVNDWTHEDVGQTTLYDDSLQIEIEYVSECHGKYWRPINEIQHTIAKYHLGVSEEDNAEHIVPGFFGNESVESRMYQFMIDLCFMNWFLGNDH